MKKYLKWYIWLSAGVILLVALLPTLCSTNPGTRLLLSTMRSTTGYDLHVESLSLSWLGPQEAKGVQFKVDKKHLTFHCSHLHTEAPLWSLSSLDVSLSVHEGRLEITPPGGAQVVFHDIEVLLTVPSKDLPLIFTASGKTEEQGIVGSFTVKGQISGLNNNDLQGSLEAEINQLPLTGVDQLLDLKGVLVAAVGPTIDATLSANATQEAIALNMHALSPQFTAQIETISDNQTLRLKSPAKITLQVTPELVDKLSLPTLTQKSQLNATLNSLSCPISQKRLQYQKLAFNASLDLASACFSEISINNLNGQLSSSDISDKIELAIDTDLLFSSFNVNAHVAATSLDNIGIRLRSDHFQTELVAKIQDDIFSVKKPFTIVAKLPVNALLAKTAEINIDIDPLSLPLKNFDVNRLEGQGKAYADQLTLAVKKGTRQFTLTNPSLQFSFNGNKQTAALKALSSIGTGVFSLDLNLKELILTNPAGASITAKGSIQNFPPSCIDPSLQTLLGSALDLNFNLNSTTEKQTLSVSAKSPNAHLSGNFLLQNNLLQLQSPGLECNILVTPESYPFIDNGPLKLIEPTVCALQLDELELPLLSMTKRIPTFNFDWNLMRFKGELSLNEVKYQQLTMNNTTMLFEKTGDVNFNFSSNLSPQGQISVVGQMPSNALSQIKINASIKDFPTIILDLFPRLMGQTDLSFVPVFGKTINAQMNLDLRDFNGPITLNLTSENTRISFAGDVVHGYLTLNESLYAQVLMTPELSMLFLNQLNPLSIKEITSKSPITLEINSEGFLLPIHPFDPSKLFMGKGKLELGKITCRNEGNINATLSLLRWSNAGRSDTLKLWFAPCDFSIKQGVIAIERTEVLLADTFDIALWGNIDLPQHYVNATLGLTSSALSSAFGIKNLPKDYVLQVPMRGPLNNVTIDSGSATTKIALLFAWQKKDLAGSLGGSKGALFGGLIDKVVPLPDMNAKAPPAKHPFPWEQSQKEKTSSRPIRKGDKPLKQLLKILR